MRAALRLHAKLNIILKNHIFAWFRTGKLSPWRLLKDMIGFADDALTAKGYKTLSELKKESEKVEAVKKPTSPRVKPKPQERNKFGKLI